MDKKRYSEKELKEFKEIILDKIQQTNKVLEYLKYSLSDSNKETYNTVKMNEDGPEASDQESICALANRQLSLIQQLEKALERINDGTYGVCIQTGELIEPDRLKLVPHTQYSLHAKVSTPTFLSGRSKKL